jgi:hypothetical protein
MIDSDSDVFGSDLLEVMLSKALSVVSTMICIYIYPYKRHSSDLERRMGQRVEAWVGDYIFMLCLWDLLGFVQGHFWSSSPWEIYLEMGFIYCQNVPGSGGWRLHWIQIFCKNTWHRNRKWSMTHIFLGYRTHHGSNWAAAGGRSSISEVPQKTWLVQSVTLW